MEIKIRKIDPSYGEYIQYHNVKQIDGILISNTNEKNEAEYTKKLFLKSGDGLFENVMNNMYSIFLKEIPISKVHEYLVIIHENGVADVYCNTIDLIVHIIYKGQNAVKAGDIIRKGDVADIQKVSFLNLDIQKSDQIIFCFKSGWNFGIYCDFSKDIDKNKMELELGKIFRIMDYEKELKLLYDTVLFKKMTNQGWFPFIRLFGGDFEKLAECYKNENYEEKLEKWLVNYNEDRIRLISEGWWRSESFKHKKDFLESGLENYYKNDKKGFIGCINTLYPTIEGMIRFQIKPKSQSKDICEYVKNKSNDVFLEDSLGLPNEFYEYLKNVFFKKFKNDLEDVDLSRHSSCHGVADSETYTKERALQLIFILDQLSFYKI